MTYDELTLATTRLPRAQRLALIEALTRSLRRELAPTAANEATTERLAAILRMAGPDSALHRLIGAGMPAQETPTEDELKEEYIDYLTRKYVHDDRPA